MQIKARAKYVKTTPDKARILSKLVVNKNPEVAITQLKFSGRDAAKYIILVLKQGMDQVKTKGLELKDFRVQTFQVDEGPKLKRRRIRHQGRATAILKRMAHLTIVLTDDGNQKSKAKSQKLKEDSKIKKEKSEGKNGSKS